MAGRSRGGINVFGTDDVGFADPSAQTAISARAANEGTGVNLETVGSGSGLLDLTRESDDTSLGAVLDEIGPAARTRAAPAMGTDMGSAALADIHEPAVDRRPLAAPVMVQALDQSAPAFGGTALAGLRRHAVRRVRPDLRPLRRRPPRDRQVAHRHGPAHRRGHRPRCRAGLLRPRLDARQDR